MNRSHRLALIAAALLALVACGAEPQEVTREVEVTRLVEVTRDVEVVAADEAGSSAAILAAFEEAFESGDYEKVRALFTDDGILTTASNTHSAFYRGNVQDADVDSADFHRLAGLHRGDDLRLLGTPIQVGDNTVAFGWRWLRSGISGTAILHLRDGKVVIAILNPSEYSIPVGGE